MLSHSRLQQLLQGSSVRPEDAVQLLIETAEAIRSASLHHHCFLQCIQSLKTDGGVLVGRMFPLNSSVHVFKTR